jgi:hypothetical protein
LHRREKQKKSAWQCQADSIEIAMMSKDLTPTMDLLAILLDPRGAQAGEAMLIDRELPREEFVDGQRVAAAGFLEGQQSAADCGYDFRLSANDPPFGTGRGKIRDGKGTTVGPDDVFHPRAMGFGHGVLTNS